MRRALLALLLLAALAVPAASGKAGPAAPGGGCKQKVTVVLTGTLLTVDGGGQSGDSPAEGSPPVVDPRPAASGGSVSLLVKRTNRHGRPYAEADRPVTVAVGARTKIRRQGQATLADLEAGDGAVVTARVCRAELRVGSLPGLTAAKIVARPASGSGEPY